MRYLAIMCREVEGAVPNESMFGFSHELSSSVPALMIIASCRASASVARDDPQFRQNFRDSGLPLSPLSAYETKVFRRQVTLGAGTTTFTEKAEPDTF